MSDGQLDVFIVRPIYAFLVMVLACSCLFDFLICRCNTVLAGYVVRGTPC